MPDLLAALGLAQLKKAEAFRQRRHDIATTYMQKLSGIDELEMPPVGDVENTHSWHLFILRLRPAMLSGSRNELVKQLKQVGIGSSVHFIPLHLHPYYRDRYGYSRGDFPNAEDAFDRCISLPIYPDMSDADVKRVFTEVEQFVVKNRHRLSAFAD
jgi:perosamine synthetase